MRHFLYRQGISFVRAGTLLNSALALLTTLLFLIPATGKAEEVKGSFVVGGKTAELRYALALEVDSTSDKGYMDVLVILSDRKVAAADAANIERLEAMAKAEGLAALVVRINPDAKVMSAEPLHPAFTSYISSAAFIRWQPTAYDEKQVAGRLWTDSTQNEFGQKWSYDLTFAATIVLDPAAKTMPKN